MKAIDKLFSDYDLEPMDNLEPWHHANPAYDEFEKNAYGGKSCVLAAQVAVDPINGEADVDSKEFIQAIKEKKFDVYYDFETLYAGDIFVVLNEKVRDSELIKRIQCIGLSVLYNSSSNVVCDHSITMIGVGDTEEFWISGNDFINLLDQPQRVKEYEEKLFEVPCDRYWGNDPDEEWDEYPVCSFDDEFSDEDDYWDEDDDWDEEEYTEVTDG